MINMKLKCPHCDSVKTEYSLIYRDSETKHNVKCWECDKHFIVDIEISVKTSCGDSE